MRLKPKTILGIDSSTTGVAWTLVQCGKPVRWGKIGLKHAKNMTDRIAAINAEFPTLLRELKPDHIFIEKTIYMRNPATLRVLSYIVGALMSLGLQQHIMVTDIEPIVAKNFYNYSCLSRKFTAAAARKLGKLPAKKFCEALRKSQVQRVNEHNFPGFDASDHDISDSCSIAIYGYNKLVDPVSLDTAIDVRLNLKELESLGLLDLLC